MKDLFPPVLSIFTAGLLLVGTSCAESEATAVPYMACMGETMGTTYSVKYADPQETDYTSRIDSILSRINAGVSTFIPTSVISVFNRTGALALDKKWSVDTTDARGHFLQNLALSYQVYAISDGAFDPTVGPLVNMWGFGWEGRIPVFPDSQKIQDVLGRIGLDKLRIDTTETHIVISAGEDSMQLDFSAVAKGYAVDCVASFLASQDVRDYFVEIGGELRAHGVNPRGESWVVGINTPSVDAPPESVYERVRIQDMSMATSGNYRNFHMIDGQKTWHSINPATGYPEQNNLLSATVIHRYCGMADALATACMILGKDGCLQMMKEQAGAEAYLIFAQETDEAGSEITPGFRQNLVDR